MSDVMDPSARRALAASRAHLVLALACLPFVAAGAGALAALGQLAPSGLGALGLAAAVVSGPLAAGLLRWSTARAAVPEPDPVPVAETPEAPLLHPRERWAREFMAWRQTPFGRSAR
jgi:hypothetical protein